MRTRFLRPRESVMSKGCVVIRASFTSEPRPNSSNCNGRRNRQKGKHRDAVPGLRDNNQMDDYDGADICEQDSHFAEFTPPPDYPQAAEHKREQWNLHKHIQQRDIPGLAEEPQVEQILSDTSGQQARIADVFVFGSLVENPIEGGFIAGVVKRLEILSAFKSHAEVMRELAPYPPRRLPRGIEIVAKRDVSAHVKSFLQADSAERRNRHELMHQPIVPHHPRDHDQAHTKHENRYPTRRREALPRPRCREHRAQQKKPRKQYRGAADLNHRAEC